MTHTWNFEPLRNRPSRMMGRETGTAGSGRLRRRPFNKQEVRELTLPAGLLLDDDQYAMFNRLLSAHKIEWQRYVGGKKKWIEYDLDVEQSIEPEFVEDIDRLERYTFKLVQSDAQWFEDFENESLQFTDYR